MTVVQFVIGSCEAIQLLIANMPVVRSPIGYPDCSPVLQCPNPTRRVSVSGMEFHKASGYTTSIYIEKFHSSSGYTTIIYIEKFHRSSGYTTITYTEAEDKSLCHSNTNTIKKRIEEQNKLSCLQVLWFRISELLHM